MICEPAAELIEQFSQQFRRVAARVHHVPVREREPQVVVGVEESGLLHPLDDESLRLRREIDDDAAFRLRHRRFDDGVEPFVAVDHHR